MMPGRPILGPGWLFWTLLGLVGAFPVHAQVELEAVDALFAVPVSPAREEQPSTPPPPAKRPVDPSIEDMLKRLDTIEARLGASIRPPSVNYNMERRLADLEKRIQQIEKQLARLPQMDQRLRRLEIKQP